MYEVLEGANIKLASVVSRVLLTYAHRSCSRSARSSTFLSTTACSALIRELFRRATPFGPPLLRADSVCLFEQPGEVMDAIKARFLSDLLDTHPSMDQITRRRAQPELAQILYRGHPGFAFEYTDEVGWGKMHLQRQSFQIDRLVIVRLHLAHQRLDKVFRRFVMNVQDGPFIRTQPVLHETDDFLDIEQHDLLVVFAVACVLRF